VEVWPGARAQLPVEPRPSHYYPARATDAALLRSSAGGRQQYERFLFYRGVGNVTLPATAQRRDERVLVRSTSGLALGAAILLEKREGVLAWHVAALDEEVEALALPAPGRGQPELEATLVGALVAQGLYEKEALAMVACWSDTWFGDGLRLIYFLPRVVTDRLLPLTLVPRPARLERVMVGRIELSRG
jgi:hypothetical protein